ncbi:peptide/nickel transport system substrate-binding protein [Actinocorallia herbida]|uniref:Peptide/nickel transport system substrate-binding protein n=1 Tax=Actinocorallia herbida TaxID=58109 RepID=A0A3N1D0E7_9ACTN|nr:ABC transporter substrate-binding protein [Actinocorallia herbida]ROO86999.1 peptide/nickel transport system substrate-binding protein [Actinocorallia herbida]
MHRSLHVLPVAALALALTACGGGSAPASARTDTLIVGTSAKPQTLDPLLASDVQTDFTAAPAYDTILGYDREDRLVPLLATEWKVSADATSIDLTLRSDVKFHDGSPLTADDVVYTLDRTAELGLGTASLIADYASAEAADATHLTIRLKKPNSSFAGALSRVYVLNAKLVEANAGTDHGQSWLATHEAGSGAYAMSSYASGQQIEFTKFDGYFDPSRGDAGTLVYRYMGESATIRDELRSGSIDVGYGMNQTDIATFEGAPGFTTTPVPSPLQLYVFFDNSEGPTADIRVRKAIRLAYDYQGHLDGILKGSGVLANGPLAKTVACGLERPDSVQNVAEAKSLLAEAGVKDLSLTLSYQPVIPEHAAAATLLQSNLRDIGIDLKLKSVTYPEFIKSLSTKGEAPQLGLMYDFPLYPDPTAMLYRVYESGFVGTGSNYGSYANPKVDALLDKALKEPDPEKACAIDKDIQEIIDDDAVSVNIASSQIRFVHRSEVGGIAYTPTHILNDAAAFTLD